MVESKAIEVLQERLERCANCSQKVNHLSLQVKWGRNDLGNLGNFRRFLEKHPEVFTCDGNTVKLVTPRVKSETPPNNGEAPSLAALEAAALPPLPLGSKAGCPPCLVKSSKQVSATVAKRYSIDDLSDYDDDVGASQDSKSHGVPPAGFASTVMARRMLDETAMTVSFELPPRGTAANVLFQTEGALAAAAVLRKRAAKKRKGEGKAISPSVLATQLQLSP